MELYLVRHAESTNNRLIDDLRASNEIGLWPEKRVADPALTERGVQQAKALASGNKTKKAFIYFNFVKSNHFIDNYNCLCWC